MKIANQHLHVLIIDDALELPKQIRRARQDFLVPSFTKVVFAGRFHSGRTCHGNREKFLYHRAFPYGRLRLRVAFYAHRGAILRISSDRDRASDFPGHSIAR